METEQLYLKWGNQHSDLIRTFDDLLSTETMVDVTLVCEGNILKAHKLILSACSPLFKNLFIENPSQHPIVILQDIKYTDLKALINFIYKGEIYISHDQLSIFLKTAKILKIKGLLDMKELHESSSNVALGVTKNNFIGSSYKVIKESTHTAVFPTSLYRNEQNRKRNFSNDPENSDKSSCKRKSVCALTTQNNSSVAIVSINQRDVSNNKERDFNLTRIKNEINTDEIIIPDYTMDEDILNEKETIIPDCTVNEEILNEEETIIPDYTVNEEILNEKVRISPDCTTNEKIVNQKKKNDDEFVILTPLIPVSSEIKENSKIGNIKPTSSGNKKKNDNEFVILAPLMPVSPKVNENSKIGNIKPASSGNKKKNDNEFVVLAPLIPVSSDINENSKIGNVKPTSSENNQIVVYIPSRSLPFKLPENHSDTNSTVIDEASLNISTPTTSYDENLTLKNSENSLTSSSSQSDKDLNSLTGQEYKVIEEKSKFMCEICRREFTCQSTLNIHLKFHTKEAPFTCDICQIKFRWRQLFLNHMKHHAGEKPFKCDICAYSCKEREELMNHIRLHVGDDAIICDICFRRYKNKHDLKRHLKIHEDKDKKFFVCDVCQVQYADKRSFNNHIMIHEEKEPHICEICDKSFPTKRSLSRHRLIH